MKRKLLVSAFSLCSFIGLQSAIASQVADDALTEFQANTPAKADEVNTNFTTLKSAVNDNDTRITTLEDNEITAEDIVGTKDDNNPSNHNRYSDREARTAVTSTDLNHNDNNIFNINNVADGKTYASVVRIRTRGWLSTIGGNESGVGEISIDGTQELELGRSYNLVVLERATGDVVFKNTYDIFGIPDESQVLADKLAEYSINHIVIIATYDEPRNNRLLNGLDQQMMRCGATSKFTGNTFKYRSAYALVGICDMGPGTGVEYYSGDVNDDTTAFIDTSVTIIDGSFNSPNTVPSRAGLIHLVTELPDVRVDSNTPAGQWADLSKRSITFTKYYSHSLLKITYQDTLGTAGSVYDGCRWRFTIDDGTTVSEVAYFSDADDQVAGWNMSNSTHTAWVQNRPIGQYTVKVQNSGNNGAWSTTTQCLSGWNTNGNFLSVEEIP